MNQQREDEECLIQERISQEEPPPSPEHQLLIGAIGIGFLLGLPVLIDWLGKNVKIK